MFRILAPVLLSSSLFLAVRTQEAEPVPPPTGISDLAQRLTPWREAHGSSWRAVPAERGGYAQLLHGGRAAASSTPLDDAQWFELARRFVEEARPLLGVEPATLADDRVTFLPLGGVGSSDKWTVRFAQVVGGVPVEDAWTNVLLDGYGSLLSIQSTAAPELRDTPAVPSFDAASATAVVELAARERGLALDRIEAPALVWKRAQQDEAFAPVLAWRIDAFAAGPEQPAPAWRTWLDAGTGVVLGSESLVHHFDVEGTVKTLATPGVKPDTGGNPETEQTMAYVRVTSSAGTVFADANGDFVYPGVNSPLDVTVEYLGTYTNVDNQSGSDYTLTTTVQPNTPTTILMNSSGTASVTAQANAYVGIYTLRDWIRSVLPGDGTADFQALANVNLNSTCNAFYNGSSVNFYQAGGGCVNTSYSTVIAHEMGHWLNVLYGTGNGSDGMGEGNADVFAMYLYDTPLVGEDFCGTGCHIRDGNNLNQFCGDCCGGCYGEVHADGEPWMGAAWKVRSNLNGTLGDALGDLTADTIFLSWMNAYDQQQIKSIIEIQWLTLDDDDGDIDNGTPHYSEIDQGFRTQGWPGFDIPFVTFSNVTDLPDTTDEVGPYAVDATIVAGVNPPLASALVHYRVNGGSFAQVAMSPLGGDVWRGSIPGQGSPAEVEYYVTGTDSGGFTESYPANAPDDLLRFDVGLKTIYLDFDFEAGGSQGWTVGAPGDSATTGIWERVDPVGTAAQPEDDHTDPPGTICWVTGQQPAGGSIGTNDVDGGDTTLTSPAFDASGLFDPKVEYWRWYSNDEGADPNNDVFEVFLSNDGGSSWVPVEVVGPGGPEASGGWFRHAFRVADLLAPTASMRLRFVASDRNAGSIVEAALDDVLGTDLAPGGITDCNGNGIDDADDIANGTSQDCNQNGIPDECEGLADCDGDGTPDVCEPDCDGDGTPDDCEVDCNGNGIPDDCEGLADCDGDGTPDVCEPDCDGDGTPDDCEVDCNGNGIPDDCESFTDCNGNGVPDECEPDCDGDGTPDDCEVDCNANGVPDDCETFSDCNGNGVPDECEPDCDGDGTPDDCEVDCNGNGIPDDCEGLADCDGDGTPDVCEPDCDGDGTPDDCEVDCNANGVPDDCETFSDCNGNGVPDECEPDCDGDGTPDDCEVDCNGNGIPDDCEGLADCDSDGTPDVCEPDCDGDGTPDDCEADCNANGVPDDCETFSDCNGNGVPDECEPDCDGDGTPDDCEADCNGNGLPDDCEGLPDCDSDGIPDVCESDSDGDGTPDDCELGVNYCGPAVVNSSGLPGVMDASGSKKVADNALTLEGSQLPVNQFGYFLVSQTQGFVQNPGGSQGNLCLAGQIGRYVKDVASTGGAGELALLVDLTQLPPPINQAVLPGETWSFQLWFRDKNPTQTSNFTDGYSILFE